MGEEGIPLLPQAMKLVVVKGIQLMRTKFESETSYFSPHLALCIFYEPLEARTLVQQGEIEGNCGV